MRRDTVYLYYNISPENEHMVIEALVEVKNICLLFGKT